MRSSYCGLDKGYKDERSKSFVDCHVHVNGHVARGLTPAVVVDGPYCDHLLLVRDRDGGGAVCTVGNG